jgi:hypothetical protein
MHPMQVMVKEDDLECLLIQRSKCRFCVLGKDRFGQALPKPRDAIFSVLHDENGPVPRDVKLLTQLARPSRPQRTYLPINPFIHFGILAQCSGRNHLRSSQGWRAQKRGYPLPKYCCLRQTIKQRYIERWVQSQRTPTRNSVSLPPRTGTILHGLSKTLLSTTY